MGNLVADAAEPIAGVSTAPCPARPAGWAGGGKGEPPPLLPGHLGAFPLTLTPALGQGEGAAAVRDVEHSVVGNPSEILPAAGCCVLTS